MFDITCICSKSPVFTAPCWCMKVYLLSKLIDTYLCLNASENEQLLEDLLERYKESKCRTEADIQKRQFDIENKKKGS